MGYRDDRYAQTEKQVKHAFERHLIRKESEGRWLLMRPHKDGWDDPDRRWDSNMWTEVICLEGEGLYVGGDIGHIIFRYGPRGYEERVFWLGRKPAWDSYVQQKASIGMGGDRHGVTEWDGRAAREDLLHEREELQAQAGDGERIEGALDAIDDAVNAIEDGPEEVYRHLMSDPCFDEPPNIGMVVSSRLIYVMGALNRLCDLLEERRG